MKNLSINKTDLELLIEKHQTSIIHNNQWTTPLSIFISLIYTLVTCEFKSNFIFSASVWKLLTILLAISMLAWLTIEIKYCKHISPDKLCEEICLLDQTIEENRALILSTDSFNTYSQRVLVYFDPIWHCYLLPHYPISNISNLDLNELALKIENDFQISQDAFVLKAPFSQQTSEKFSMRAQKQKRYTFVYIELYLKTFPSTFKQKSFSIFGKNYCWLSLAELQSDKTTMAYNPDVVNFLEKYSPMRTIKKEDEIID